MNRLLSILLILAVFTGAAAAAEINGSAVSFGKKLADQKVTLSTVSSTQSAEGGTVFSFNQIFETSTDRNGGYAFGNLNEGMYRVNLTYNGITYGETFGLKDKASVDFNLSEKIEGYVLKMNQTPEGVPVRLMDETGVEIMKTLTNKSGKYSFKGVNSGKSYLVEAAYADVPYTKRVNASEDASFVVYESTKDGNELTVSVDHIIMSPAANGIKVEEYVVFTNTGDKVFFSKDRAFVGISTPEGISRFQTDAMECCLQREKDSAWIDPMNPILPGETYTAQISYVFNPESSRFFKGTIYNTSIITVLTDKKNGFSIDNQFARKETIPNEGKEFEVLSFMNVPGGQRFDIQISGYVPSKTGGSEFNYLIPVAALVLIGAVSYPLLKNRIGKKKVRRFVKTPTLNAPAGEPTDEAVPGQDGVPIASVKDITEMSFEELLAEKSAVFESILALDNRFNSGEIAEKEYREIKKQYKDNATLVIKQLKEAALNMDLSQPVPALEKMIAHIGDIDILEELLDREKEGENRVELKEIMEQRIDDIERYE